MSVWGGVGGDGGGGGGVWVGVHIPENTGNYADFEDVC